MRFYCVFDAELNSYSVPFVADNDLIAQRQFFLGFDKYPDTVVSQMQLVSIGSFIADTGSLVPEDLVVIAKGEGIVEWRKEHSFKETK